MPNFANFPVTSLTGLICYIFMAWFWSVITAVCFVYDVNSRIVRAPEFRVTAGKFSLLVTPLLSS